MRPFRAPREARKISKGTSVTCEAEVATQEATPDLLQASSQDETALGTVWKPWREKTWVIKETQHPEEEPALTLSASPQVQGTHSVAPSPSLSEFEGLLGALEAIRKEVPIKRRADMSNDEWWNSVLEAEKQRCQDDLHSRQVEVDDILLGDVSSDDDIPIASTLPAKKSTRKGKKKSKVLWTYETVIEPTGVSSKYWDASAPPERATKKQAKDKLIAINVAENQSRGLNHVAFLFFFRVTSWCITIIHDLTFRA